MATTFLLIRHGDVPTLNKVIVGRMPGIHLTPAGEQQARALAQRLASLPIQAIYASPLERAQETAAPLAEKLGLAIQTQPELHEVGFGEWTGKTFEELAQIPRWRLYNEFRTGVRIPGGELAVEMQARMVTFIDELRRRHGDQLIALFSHGDPIRAALLYYAAMPLDFIKRFEVSTASVSVVALDDYGPVIKAINYTGDTVPL